MTSEKKNFGKKFLSDLKLYSDYFKWNEKLNRYETYLDRKFEKTLAMLIRLKESQNLNQFKDDNKAIDV